MPPLERDATSAVPDRRSPLPGVLPPLIAAARTPGPVALVTCSVRAPASRSRPSSRGLLAITEQHR